MVILMPNFTSHEVHHAMGLVFVASGLTYQKQDVKNQLREPIGKNEFKIEKQVFNVKDEDFLHIKIEVDSDEYEDVECMTEDGRDAIAYNETSHNSEEVEMRSKI